MQNFVKSGAQSRVRFFLVLLIAFLIVFFSGARFTRLVKLHARGLKVRGHLLSGQLGKALFCFIRPPSRDLQTRKNW